MTRGTKLCQAIRFAAVAAAAAMVAPPLPAAIPQAERDALVALYNATRGGGWWNRSGWLGPPGSAGPDPSAGSRVGSYRYDGFWLRKGSGSFDPFTAAGYGHGVNVSAGSLGI